jgi:hypothetical protein
VRIGRCGITVRPREKKQAFNHPVDPFVLFEVSLQRLAEFRPGPLPAEEQAGGADQPMALESTMKCISQTCLASMAREMTSPWWRDNLVLPPTVE